MEWMMIKKEEREKDCSSVDAEEEDENLPLNNNPHSDVKA